MKISDYFDNNNRFSLNDKSASGNEELIEQFKYGGDHSPKHFLKWQQYNSFSERGMVFSSHEIAEIIKYGNLYQKNQAQVGNGGEGTVDMDNRRTKVSWITPNKWTNFIYDRLLPICNEVNESDFQYDLTYVETLQFCEYNSNEQGCYNKHTDMFGGWYSSHTRKLSFVLQLSDPWEYEGGELQLWFGEYPTSIQKEKGRLVFFPSYALHQVTPVISGVRYSLVGWVHGPAFK